MREQAKVLAVGVVAFLAVLGALYLYGISHIHSPVQLLPAFSPLTVNVSGAAASSMHGISIHKILFSSSSGNYSSVVAGGNYMVKLPYPGSYSITLFWNATYKWQSGSVIGGSLNMTHSYSPEMTDNIYAATPYSTIIVTGNVSAGPYGTAESVLFTAGNGDTFSTGVSSGKYSERLPNMMSYSVSVQYSTVNPSASCNAGTALINEGVGIGNYSKSFACNQ
ncbi:MAG: hypothetical protein ACREBH_00335 [Candidatus Micrarchaeaceae archaeon]